MGNREIHVVYFYHDSVENKKPANAFLKVLSKHSSKIYAVCPQGVSVFEEIDCEITAYSSGSACIQRIVGTITANPPERLIICSDEAMGFVGDVEKIMERISNAEVCCACAQERADGKPCFSSAFFSVAPSRVKPEKLCALLGAARSNLSVSCDLLDSEIEWLCDSSFWLQFTDRPMMLYPRDLIRAGCPVFLKSVFTCNYADTLNYANGETAYELFEELKNTSYDADTLLEYLIKNLNQADLQKILHLNYVLNGSGNALAMKTPKIALVMHLYYEDMLDTMYQYASSMPETADLYITTNTKEKADTIKKVFAPFRCSHFEVRVIPNRGRDVSSIIVGVADVIRQYQYVCFVHDKKSLQSSSATIGQSFGSMLLENTLGSKAFVCSVIDLFEREPRLGILSPPAPNHADYYPVLGFEWGNNFEGCAALANRVGVDCSILQDKEPVAPLGTCFWFRPEAFRLFYEAGFTYEDFPPEPNNIDGTILHAFERIYSFVPQQLGYYPATVMSDRYARIEIDNLRHYVRTLNKIMFHGFGMNMPFMYLKQYLNDFFAQRTAFYAQRIEYEKTINYLTKNKSFYLRFKEAVYLFLKKHFPNTFGRRH